MAESKSSPSSYHVYKWVDRNGADRQLRLADDHERQFKQALADFSTNKKYVFDTWIHIWNRAIKSHLLYSGDRRQYIENWQANIHLGLIRGTMDTYTAFLTTSPLQWNVLGVDEKAFSKPKGREDEADAGIATDYARNAINFIADITKFNRQIAIAMQEGMMLGTYWFRTGHDIGKDNKIETVSMIDGVPTDVVFEYTKPNVPVTVSCDPYNIFADPYNGKEPLNVFERKVTSINDFLKTFLPVIKHKDNEIEFKEDELAWMLAKPCSKVPADFTEYGNVRNEILSKVNQSMFSSDSLYNTERMSVLPQTTIFGSNKRHKDDGKCEYIYGIYDDRIVLIANGYPVYIGKNFYKCIPYTNGTAFEVRGLHSEGIPYLLHGLEDTQNSFYNNLVDNARSASIHRWVQNDSIVTKDIDVNSVGPGGVIKAQGNPREAFALMETPRLTDYGLMNLSDFYGQKLSGVSEINQGATARVRTAGEASALVGATNTRLNQFFQRFSVDVGGAGEMMLRFSRMLWTADQWGYTRDIDGKQYPLSFKNTDLDGSFYVSLDGGNLFSFNKDLQIEVMNRTFDRFKQFLGPEELKQFMRTIFRTMGLNPNTYMPPNATLVDRNMKNEPSTPPGEGEAALLSGGYDPAADAAQQITAAVSSQENLGNGGQGQ